MSKIKEIQKKNIQPPSSSYISKYQSSFIIIIKKNHHQKKSKIKNQNQIIIIMEFGYLCSKSLTDKFYFFFLHLNPIYTLFNRQ